LRPQTRNFLIRHAKCEVWREARGIAPNLLVQPFGCHSVESGQFGVEQDLLSSHHYDSLGNKVRRHGSPFG
jgi:hypothetical protein